ncbi:DUF1643 domain-containing protein [Alteribacillus sp. HJP-4]|uniref:DUF1643 domain-containing protein n=1 Tax=Alteribacillus sp. HJP-4 TaxID=2775394 RepID=UPI0035CCD834
MEFVKAEALKKEYAVDGSFYNANYSDQVFECRNYAHIYNKHDKSSKRLDAILTLVNPGLCSPANASDLIPGTATSCRDLEKFTPAKTDNTQYQVMRLMKLKNWNKVLIINLSDLRAGNLKELYKKLSAAQHAGFAEHSIFSESRKKELERLVFLCDGPIIVGWGTDPIVNKLAPKALSALPKNRTVGLPHNKGKYYYYHPSPPRKDGKEFWLKSIAEKIS